MSGQFSIQTIVAITDVVTGGSGNSSASPIGIYRSGPTLESFLGAAGIEFQLRGGSRVPCVHEELRRQNESDNGRQAIKRLIEQVTDPREYHHVPEKLDVVVNHLNGCLFLDGVELKKESGKYKLVNVLLDARTEKFQTTLERLNFDSAKVDFDRAITQSTDDPESAVTSACSMVESIFKCLIDEMKIDCPANQDISSLAKAIEDRLNLSPGRSEIEPDIKRILGGLSNVVRGIGSLRTHSGDAHGRGRSVRRLDARISRLAINAASAVSFFYIETWQKQKGSFGSAS